MKSTAIFVLLGLLLIAWAGYSIYKDSAPAAPTPTALAILESTPVQAVIPQETPPPAVENAEAPEDENTFLAAPTLSSAEAAEISSVEPEELHIPDRILIPAISLDAPVIEAKTQTVTIMGQKLPQWLAPDEFAAGWHTDSAGVGQVGNLVLNGHHNVHGEVFGKLVDLKPGDIILVSSGEISRRYQVTNTMILPERYEPLEKRLENARWLQPSPDERVTLVTCWPKTSNTYRLIVVAAPAE